MKKIILLLATIVVGLSVNAQRIKKHEIDKFTKAEVIETSSETLYSSTYMLSGYNYKFDFLIRCYNGEFVIAANVLMQDVVKYDETDGITFLLENDETVTLRTNFTGVGGERFAQGYWFTTSFNIPKEDVEKLKKYNITDVRITYVGGHYDKEIKGKKQQLIKKMLNLFE